MSDYLLRLDGGYRLRQTSSHPDEEDRDRELTEEQASHWLSEAIHQLEPPTPRQLELPGR